MSREYEQTFKQIVSIRVKTAIQIWWRQDILKEENLTSGWRALLKNVAA